VKLSGSAIKEEQAKQFAMYAREKGIGLSYLFMNAPTQAEKQTLEAWIKEVAPNVEVHINYLYP
jgi:hypothetical protein